MKPNLIDFSEVSDSTGDIVVISFTLVLKHFIGNSKATTFLHMADEQPKILRRTVRLLRKLDEAVSYMEDMEEYLKENKKIKKILVNDFGA